MNSFLTCPDCDTDLELGPVDVQQDCISYTQRYSQLCGLIIHPNDAPLPTDWTDTNDWTTVLDNSISGNIKGRYLVGEGELDAPDDEEVDYPKRRVRISNRLYTIEFTVKNLSDVQYAFLQQLQCGWTDFVFWHETVGGRLFGGPTGIIPYSVNVTFPYGGGRNDKELAIIELAFESDGDPPRADVTGIAAAAAAGSTTYVAFGPVDDSGAIVFGPVDGGSTVFGFPSP